MSDKRIPAAVIREAWLDLSLTSGEAAAKVGLARSNLQKHAKALGLAPRPKGRPPKIDDELLPTMWRAGIRVRDIAEHFGCADLTVSQAARRLALPPRLGGGRKVVRLSAWLAQRYYESLARAMEHSAQQTCGARKMAEMVDGKTSKVAPVRALSAADASDRRAA